MLRRCQRGHAGSEFRGAGRAEQCLHRWVDERILQRPADCLEVEEEKTLATPVLDERPYERPREPLVTPGVYEGKRRCEADPGQLFGESIVNFLLIDVETLLQRWDVGKALHRSAELGGVHGVGVVQHETHHPSEARVRENLLGGQDWGGR